MYDFSIYKDHEILVSWIDDQIDASKMSLKRAKAMSKTHPISKSIARKIQLEIAGMKYLKKKVKEDYQTYLAERASLQA